MSYILRRVKLTLLRVLYLVVQSLTQGSPGPRRPPTGGGDDPTTRKYLEEKNDNLLCRHYGLGTFVHVFSSGLNFDSRGRGVKR